MKIAGATMTIIFSLATCFSGALAWFGQQRSATVTTGSFSVTAPEGVSYDLYYLHNFTLDEGTKDGNYDSTTNSFIGYEIPEGSANFTQVSYDDQSGEVINDPNPTVISNLWPNHFLTYALVVTGSVSTFKLTTWNELRRNSIVNDNGDEISLSWAINIYSKAYYVQDVVGNPNISGGFSTFENERTAQTPTVVNKFKYDANNNFDEDHIAPTPKPEITFFNSISGVSGAGQHIIVYFSIEFSNDSSTFYTYDQTNAYFVRDANGDSNCYKSLQLYGLNFNLS